MNAVLMKHVLSTHLIPSAQLHFNFHPPEQWYLLHDNDKKFTSELVQTHLHNTGVTTLDFPPYSPDLNPIENLWSILQQETDKYNADTMEKLQDIIAEEWKNIDVNICRKLVHSMPDRIQAVIHANGYYTRF